LKPDIVPVRPGPFGPRLSAAPITISRAHKTVEQVSIPGHSDTHIFSGNVISKHPLFFEGGTFPQKGDGDVFDQLGDELIRDPT
jgi:hypothetical protein